AEVAMIRSFEEQPERKRQSSHTAYTVPAPSTAAVGLCSAFIPFTTWFCRVLKVTGAVQDAPPFVERYAMREEVKVATTTTVPSGRRTGWTSYPTALLTVETAGPHVAPPSMETLASSRSFRERSAHTA